MSTTIGCPIPGASQPKEQVRLIDIKEILQYDGAHFTWSGGRNCLSEQKAAYARGYDAGMKFIVDEAKKAPIIDPESMRPTAHWVSVKDRLPDPYEKVLVRLDHWAGVDTYLAFYDTERGWCDYGGYFDDGTNNEGEPHTYETAGVNVTHWMSLPRLPEEEGYYV